MSVFQPDPAFGPPTPKGPTGLPGPGRLLAEASLRGRAEAKPAAGMRSQLETRPSVLAAYGVSQSGGWFTGCWRRGSVWSSGSRGPVRCNGSFR
jgi:hypothetical protein